MSRRVQRIIHDLEDARLLSEHESAEQIIYLPVHSAPIVLPAAADLPQSLD
jgi:hypothetical protein